MDRNVTTREAVRTFVLLYRATAAVVADPFHPGAEESLSSAAHEANSAMKAAGLLDLPQHEVLAIVRQELAYEAYQRRAIEPDGTVHAARYAGDRDHFTLACAVYPMPDIDRLVHDGDGWTVTCPGCKTALDGVGRSTTTVNH